MKNIDSLKEDLIKNFNSILEKLNKNIEGVKSNLRGYIFTQLAEQTIDLNASFLEMLTAQLLLLQTTLLDLFMGVIRAQSNEIDGMIGFSELKLRKSISNLENNLNNFKSKIYSYLDTKDNKTGNDLLDNWYKDNKKGMFKTSSSYICERIVGESYIKYDANYMYLPTIILRYKTKNKLDERKYSQIKIRLNYKTEEITTNLVNVLKTKINAVSLINYTCGNLRCNYVSEKRLFKTTVFCNSKETVLNLFKYLIELTNTKSIKENFSFTENSRRNHNLRRDKSLNNIKLNKFNDFVEVDMTLASAYLQVNGLERQIGLF